MSFRATVDCKPDAPLISFTFDDFPHSALSTGGEILRSFGTVGSYYVCLGRLGADSPSGPLCTAEDVARAWNEGHEIGCHTFSHCHSWNTEAAVYESSIHENSAAFAELIPGGRFRSFSYPLAFPRPALKRICARYFQACRGGGQRINAGTTDLNQLSAYFLEKTGENFRAIEDLIDENARKCGWLIFATHDVDRSPSRFGCTTEFFTRVVQYAVNSGAQVVPVIRAAGMIQNVRTAA
jgi:peptidoglycan/xylan/chitin deacetylase (PgdA/CDA1 family)